MQCHKPREEKHSRGKKKSPNEFSKKSVVGNLQGNNFSKEAVAEVRLQGVSE